MRYLACETPHPVVSVAGLCRVGYSANFDDKKTCLMWKGHHRADISTDRGLYLLEPKRHSRPRYASDNVLVAPVARSSSYAAPEAPAVSAGTPTAKNSTIEKLWHKNGRPQKYTRGSRRSGRGDY